MVIQCVMASIACLRMGVILRETGQPNPLSDYHRWIWIAQFLSFLLPASVGQDLVRGFYMHRGGIALRDVANILFLDHLIGVLVLSALCVPGLSLLLDRDAGLVQTLGVAI